MTKRDGSVDWRGAGGGGVEGLNGSQKRAKWVPGETRRNVYEYFHDYGVESRNPGPAPAGEAHANTSRESWFLKRYRSRGG